MSLRSRRATVRRSERPAAAAPGGRSVYAVEVALDARLFGRFRLLSIDAAIDVAEPVDDHHRPTRRPGLRSGRPVVEPRTVQGRRVAPGPGANGASPHRRREAEALLGDAERSLGATPAPQT